MNKDYRHKCAVVRCWVMTHRKILCDTCVKKHEQTGCYEQVIRAWYANRCWSTAISKTAYHQALQALVKDIPVSRKRKSEFMGAMEKGYGKSEEL